MMSVKDPDHLGIAAFSAARLRLNHTVTELLGVLGTSFEETMTQAADHLPEDLRRETLRLLADIRAYQAAPDHAFLGDILFDMGILHEKIRAQSQAQMEIESAIIDLEGVRASPLNTPESERISRFIALRDEIFRKVADITLKAILIIFCLMILGLLIGIV